MIYISNDIYIGGVSSGVIDPNYPLIGWRSVLSLSDFSSPHTASGSSIAALWSPDTYTFWTSTDALTEAHIVLSNSGLAVVDYVAIVGHNLAGQSFKIQSSADGVSYSDITDLTQAVDGNAILVYFDQVQTAYLRIVMTSSAAREFRVAHVRAGRILRCQRKVYVGMVPFTLDKRVEKVVTVSDSGKYLGAIAKSITNRYSLNQPDNKPAFVRTEIDPFLDHCDLIRTEGNGPIGTFIAAWRPGEYPREVLYCHPPEQIQRPQNQRNNGMMEWSISGEAEAWQSV